MAPLVAHYLMTTGSNISVNCKSASMLYTHIIHIGMDARGCVQVTNVNAKGAFFFLREAGRTLSDGGKIITCVWNVECSYFDPASRLQTALRSPR
jgi:hypothetical protein